MLEQVKKWMPFKRGDKNAKRVGGSQEAAHPLARMERDLHAAIDRLGFGSLWSSPFGNGADPWFGDFSPAVCTPTLDVADKRNHIEVTIELPGMESDDVEIDVREGALVIRGEKRSEETTEDEGYYRTERSFGAFERAIPLPSEVDADKTEAAFKKGVLKVTLPKAKPAPSAKRVPIKPS